MRSNINGNVFEQDEYGNWVLEKANIPNLKSNPKYKDAPRYPLIYDYEGEFKQKFYDTTKKIKNDLQSKLDKFISNG